MNKENFQTIYTQYYPIVYKQVYYLLGDNTYTEDITQEVFIKYYHESHKKIEFIGAWLSKVAAHTTLNYIRSEKRRIKREEDIFLDTEEIFSLEERMIRSEEVTHVRQVLSQLNEQQRICLLLKFSGYTYDEIHRATGIPKNNISQNIARGKQRFQQLYQKEGEVHVLRPGYPSASY